MEYFLDTEFLWGGPIISLALVPFVGDRELYIARPDAVRDDRPWTEHALNGHSMNEWVYDNVIGVIDTANASAERLPVAEWAKAIEIYLHGDDNPLIVSDWPSDVEYFARLMITGPGQMIMVPRIMFEVARVDAYPTTVDGAVQHNALWDARALRAKLSGGA